MEPSNEPVDPTPPVDPAPQNDPPADPAPEPEPEPDPQPQLQIDPETGQVIDISTGQVMGHFQPSSQQRAAEPRTKLDTLPQDVQDYIHELREEAKARRVQNEEILGSIQAQQEEADYYAALDEAAEDAGIAEDKRDYFNYLMNRAMDSLPEGAELPQEAIDDIVKTVTSVSGKTQANSTVAGGATPPSNSGVGGAEDSPTQAEFDGMNMHQRQELFTKNRAAYDRLASVMKQRNRHGGGVSQVL